MYNKRKLFTPQNSYTDSKRHCTRSNAENILTQLELPVAHTPHFPSENRKQIHKHHLKMTFCCWSRSSTLPRGPRSIDLVNLEGNGPLDRNSSTLDRRSTTMMTSTVSSSTSSVQQRGFRPPQINLGTWNERPKSEITLKQDSDYRIGVGQLQARAAPVVRQAEPKPPKENLNLLSSGEPVVRSNSWRVTQQPPYKSSVTIHSLATEQVRVAHFFLII
jgi:hypothetical protein